MNSYTLKSSHTAYTNTRVITCVNVQVHHTKQHHVPSVNEDV